MRYLKIEKNVPIESIGVKVINIRNIHTSTNYPNMYIHEGMDLSNKGYITYIKDDKTIILAYTEIIVESRAEEVLDLIMKIGLGIEN